MPKEKTVAQDYANSFAPILKYDKNDDGTLMVYGNATDDTLDLDQQICDPKWLDEAMPQWFKSGGNIREMHGPSAAGVAKEYEAKGGKHIIGVHVVDPIAVKKVETRVYTGFSVGIKSPRVVRDTKAANGRIIDGQIIEVSLVDRPANPSAKLILAKSVEGEASLVQVEEVHELETQTEKGSKMETIKQITELAKSLTTDDLAKFDKTLFDNARRALAELIASEALEMTEGHDERGSLANLVNAVYSLMSWYEGEEHEGEVAEVLEEKAASDDADANGENEDKAAKACDDGKCGKCVECMSDKSVEAPDTTQEEETDQATIKSAEVKELETENEVEFSAETPRDVVEEETEDSNLSIDELVEKAVKSAMELVKSEIDTLRADKEAAVEKSVKLENELATALTKAVAGGPKRTASSTVAVSNEYLVKALTYKAKADATNDPVLAKGYRDLHEEFLAKANAKSEDK